MHSFARVRNSLLLSLLLIALTAVAGQATDHQVTLPMDDTWATGTTTGNWLAEIIQSPDQDRELAPSITWWWLLEQGEVIESAELIVDSEQVVAPLTGTPDLIPMVSSAGKSVHLDVVEPLWNTQFSLDISPPVFLHGRLLQSITVTPLRRENDTLVGLTAAAVNITTGWGDTATPIRPERDNFPLRERILERLGTSLLNPSTLPLTMDRGVGGESFPTDVPSIDGSVVEMVIVTPDSFADICQDYADYKTGLGIPTVVRSIEWIQQRYPFGSDRAEMIRRFLQDAYTKWSINYAILAADSDEIPPRYATTRVFGDPTTSPTDLYYACLDGDWNADHDGEWAEAAILDDEFLGDEADLMPEICVGRLPATDRANCTVLFDKSRSYSEGVVESYQERILLLGEVLFPASWTPGTPIVIDGATYCEEIYLDATGPQHDVIRVYENSDSFPTATPLTRASAMDSMNSGCGIVLHNGHGQRQTMSVGDGSLGNAQIETLHNGDQTFLLYMVNCTAAAFDYNSIAEVFLANDDGGAWGVIGSTRVTFPVISRFYMSTFFGRANTDPSLRLGNLYNNMLITYNDLTVEDDGHRWAQTTFTLLADPSNWLHYGPVGNLQVEHAASHELGGGPLTVTVRDEASQLLPHALVSIRKGDEDYQWVSTDAMGLASFDLKAETAGNYTISVNARDGNPWNGIIPVTAPVAAPLLSLAEVVLDDTADGTVIGNGNGIAEAGETVRVTLTLANNGTATATATTVALASAADELLLLDDTDSYGDLPVGNSSPGSDPYLIQLLDVADDAIIPFTLTITCTEGIYGEEFFIETAAPLLTLHRTDIDDSVGGDGDGNIAEGESATITVELANRGRAAASGVQASITAPPTSGLTVVQGSSALGDLPPFQIGLGPASFDISRTGPEPPELLLTLTDAYGSVDSFDLLLERPVGIPSAPEYQYGQNPTQLTLTWIPAIEEDAAAYIVYRSAEEGGTFTAVSSDWVESSTFLDAGLETFTSYWYRVQPLSASGLLGTISAVSQVTTNLGLMSGWPVSLAAESASTPVVADFTGNGEFEVMVGADLVYGFHINGKELLDGDGDPETIGPISDLGDRFHCALTAANLTSSPGIELVAGSWETGEVFVWEFTEIGGVVTATVADGWPRPIANPNGYGIWGSPSVANVNDDPVLEIFVTDVGGYLNAWRSDGEEVIDGDDNPGTDGIFATGMGGWVRATPAFADIDDDGEMEIFITTSTGYLKGLDELGDYLPGFPFFAGSEGIFGSAVAGDIDDDGRVEIVFAAENDSLYAVNTDGSRVTGFPIHWRNDNSTLTAPTPALADVDGDEVMEIFACSVHTAEEMWVAWIDGDGEFLPGWPVDAGHHSQSSPVIADIDGDDDLEVILGNEFAEIKAWHHDATEVDGFPLITGDFNRAIPTLQDIDQDGLLDMIFVGWDKNVYIWQFPTVFSAEATPWHTYMHDYKRSGNVEVLDWVVSVGEEIPIAPVGISLDPNWPNPFNPTTHFSFTIGGAETEQVGLAIFDVRGRLVTELVTEELQPGTYQRTWNGVNGSGETMPSGVYFARLRVGKQIETRKITLLK